VIEVFGDPFCPDAH